MRRTAIPVHRERHRKKRTRTSLRAENAAFRSHFADVPINAHPVAKYRGESWCPGHVRTGVRAAIGNDLILLVPAKC